MMILELKVRTTEEILIIRRRRNNKPDGDFINRETTPIPGAVASGEVTATPVDTYKEVIDADNRRDTRN